MLLIALKHVDVQTILYSNFVTQLAVATQDHLATKSHGKGFLLFSQFTFWRRVIPYYVIGAPILL